MRSRVFHIPAILLGMVMSLPGSGDANPYAGNLVVWGARGNLTRPVVGIAAGKWHSLALQDDSTVIAWGSFWTNETRVPVGLRQVVAIASAWDHSIALRADGTTVSWGARESMPILPADTAVLHPPANLPPARSVAAGYRKSAIVDHGGKVHLWGSSLEGFQPPDTLGRVAHVSLGRSHVLALLEDGSIATWGASGAARDSLPTGSGRVSAIAAGPSYSIAVMDGVPVVWGDTAGGVRIVPEGISGVSAVAAGSRHVVALRNDGTVHCWGDNAHGQTNTPDGLTEVVAIAAGERHSLALRADGSVVAWGDDFYGQRKVPGTDRRIVRAAIGMDHLLLVDAHGNVQAWGGNVHGETDVPADLDGVVDVAASQYASTALRKDGTVVVWGANSATEYKPPEGLKGVRKIVATTGFHALLDSGGVVSWPKPAPPGLPSLVDVCSFQKGFLGLTPSGRLVEWKDSSSWSWRSPDTLGVVVSLSCDADGAVVARADGSIASWGEWYPERKSPPADLTNVARVLVTPGYGAAVRKDGSVSTWGGRPDDPDRWNVPQGLGKVQHLAAGSNMIAAVVEPPSVVSFRGSNDVATLPPGTYSARLHGLDGRLRWKGTGTWNGTRWRIPHDTQGIHILHAETPTGIHTSRWMHLPP